MINRELVERLGEHLGDNAKGDQFYRLHVIVAIDPYYERFVCHVRDWADNAERQGVEDGLRAQLARLDAEREAIAAKLRTFTGEASPQRPSTAAIAVPAVLIEAPAPAPMPKATPAPMVIDQAPVPTPAPPKAPKVAPAPTAKELPFPCPKCDRHFATEHGLSVHVARAHGDGEDIRWKCRTCGEDTFAPTIDDPSICLRCQKQRAA